MQQHIVQTCQIKNIKMKLNNLTYAIIRIDDLPKVDFSQVGETSQDTVRKNILTPPTQFVLKWSTEPTFIADGTIIPDGLYTHQECLDLMATAEWSEPMP